MHRQAKALLDFANKHIDLFRPSSNRAIHVQRIATHDFMNAPRLDHLLNMLEPCLLRRSRGSWQWHGDADLIRMREPDPFLAPIYA